MAALQVWRIIISGHHDKRKWFGGKRAYGRAVEFEATGTILWIDRTVVSMDHFDFEFVCFFLASISPVVATTAFKDPQHVDVNSASTCDENQAGELLEQ